MLIDDIEYAIFRHPDLSAVRDFMIGYGLVDAGQEESCLYLRSHGDAPFSYVTTRGEAGFVGMGFRVTSTDALDRLARRFGTDVEDCPHPGGGRYLRTIDPEGRRLEFVFGANRSRPVASIGAPVWHGAHASSPQSGYRPSQVLRLGHLAVFSPEPRKMVQWYGKHLGMRPSELIHDGNEANVIASFMRLDKGPSWTDHHTVAIVRGPAPALDHVSFECRDIADGDKRHRHRWGIGRHFRACRSFDYWTDPAGFHVEHYSDGDRVNEDSPTLSYPFGRDALLQWMPYSQDHEVARR